MFALDFLFIAVPAALIALLIVGLAARWLRLLPAGMGSGWLVLPTLGLAAGGTMLAFTVEEFVFRPMGLQQEILGRQVVTPLSLRKYTFWGMIMDPGWQWEYAIEPSYAAQLRRGGCRPDPGRTGRCAIGDALDMTNERAAGVTVENATTLTVVEYFW